jgi:hypothetical protein
MMALRVALVPILAVLILALGSIGCGRTAIQAQYYGCCKVCNVGKACGDTCIAAWKTCWVGPGCTCDGSAKVSPDRVAVSLP